MINLAVIGIGNWGKNWLRSVGESKKARLYACCDSDKNRLILPSKKYPKTTFTHDVKDIIKNEKINGIIIATSAPTHFKIAKEAIKSGKHVLIEKPFVLKSAHAKELIAIAKTNKRVLMVGHLLRYHPGIIKLKSIIENGKLGNIYYISSQRVNLGKIRKDENALWSFAPHDISTILYLMNKRPFGVNAIGSAYIQRKIEDVVFLNLHFRNRKMAHVHMSWLDPHKIRQTVVVGSKKMAVFDDMEPTDKLKIYDKGVSYNGRFLSYQEAIRLREGKVSAPSIKMEEPLKRECNHFIDCGTKRKIPNTDGKEGLEVVRVLEGAQKSLKQKGAFVNLD